MSQLLCQLTFEDDIDEQTIQDMRSRGWVCEYDKRVISKDKNYVVYRCTKKSGAESITGLNQAMRAQV